MNSTNLVDDEYLNVILIVKRKKSEIKEKELTYSISRPISMKNE